MQTISQQIDYLEYQKGLQRQQTDSDRIDMGMVGQEGIEPNQT